MDVPRITYYAKVIDNLTGRDITSYKNAMDNLNWYYGKINGTLGGESQYIVEFDIWNNEEAFNHRTFDVHCKTAKNVKLNIEIDRGEVKKDETYITDLSYVPFLYGRILTDGYGEYQLITDKKPLLIKGNLNPELNELSGEGDHCIVQTKIIMPKNTMLQFNRYNFHLALTYDFD